IPSRRSRRGCKPMTARCSSSAMTRRFWRLSPSRAVSNCHPAAAYCRGKRKRARLSARPLISAVGKGSGVFAFSLLFLVLLLFLRQFLAGGLIDHLHGQANLAALVEAHQLDPDLVAFLDHIGG